MTLIWVYNPDYEAENEIAPVRIRYDCAIDLKYTYFSKKAGYFLSWHFLIVSNVFVDKRINSCEDPSRYNVKRLYIYAKDVKESPSTRYINV